MKKFFLILYGGIMVVTLIASVYLYTHQKPAPLATDQEPTNGAQETGPLYAYSANGERGPLVDPTKEAISIDPTTGDTVLSDQPNYILEFFGDDRTFTITLLGSNLRESRIKAET